MMRNLAVCDKCIELDRRIEQCRRISGSINDRLTIERLEAVIKNLEEQKIALHPEPKGKPEE
jgi:hypothetical protein